MPLDNLMVFSGTANPGLSEAIARHLGVPLSKCAIERFKDGEIYVEILDHVRGRDVFIVQPTCAPGNDHLMELLILIDAAKRSSAARITAVIPYYGYARADRRVRSARVAITARLVADMITAAGAHRVLTMDLHADQIQGFFSIPVDNIYAAPVMLGDLWRRDFDGLMVVSPDVGGVVRARAMATHLGCELAIIDKRRPKPNEAKVMHVIGDVDGRTCVLVDDLVDTAGTLCAAAGALKEHGAKRVLACCTHAVLSGRAIANIEESAMDELMVTDTIPLRPDGRQCLKIRQLSVAQLLGESIRRVADEESVSSLFVQ